MRRWEGPGGYRELLSVAVPLILSQGVFSLQQFIDRVFLAWYSPEAVAASTPAGILNVAIIGLFFGTAGYVSTFVAQYDGAGRKREVGHALWQGVYISVAGGGLMMLLAPAAPAIFRFVGHSQPVQQYEVIFFETICWGSIPAILNVALSGFFSGRGKTWPLLWINLVSTSVNGILDYVLIFGRWGFPSLGIRGAAIATVAASFVGLASYIVVLCRPRFNRVYALLSGWRPDWSLLARILRFGLPSGIQVFVDVMGFTVFILLVGRLGTASLAATNIAFNINSLAFMPMFGLGTAVSMLVGRYIGEQRVELAARSSYSGAWLSLAYMTILGCAYLLLPRLFLLPFGMGSSAYREIRRAHARRAAPVRCRLLPFRRLQHQLLLGGRVPAIPDS